jgi:hypothetical protein
MSTTPKRTVIPLPGAEPPAPKSTPPLVTIDEQLFHFSLSTIVSAHLYGHMSEAHALRAIVRAMRERLFENAPPGAGAD